MKRKHDELLSILAFNCKVRHYSGVTLPIPSRRDALKAMLRMFTENEKAILDAVWEDLRRPVGESLYYDVLMVGRCSLTPDCPRLF